MLDERIDFIKENFKDYQQIDPYTNAAFVDRVMDAFFEAGFYKTKPKNESRHQSVIGIILKAQGKAKPRNCTHKKKAKSKVSIW